LLEVVSYRLRLGLRLRNDPARDWRWQAKPEANAALVARDALVERMLATNMTLASKNRERELGSSPNSRAPAAAA
jgi:hypothetical protein